MPTDLEDLVGAVRYPHVVPMFGPNPDYFIYGECAHRGPLPKHTSLMCMVCNRSGAVTEERIKEAGQAQERLEAFESMMISGRMADLAKRGPIRPSDGAVRETMDRAKSNGWTPAEIQAGQRTESQN